jgi:uncharacterized protein YcbX
VPGTVAEIWRYPIKSHGAERVGSATLEPDRTLPGDRLWAVLHEAARETGDTGWISCNNFTRVAKMPALAAVSAALSDDGAQVTLSHPDRPTVTINPESDEARFLEWVRPLMEPGRAQPVRLVRAQARGMTDSPEPTLSLHGFSSHRAVEQKLGKALHHRRWRGNVWIDGLGPWEEFEWIGRSLRIGTAEVEVIDRITRCQATAANPETGRRDADTLGALEQGWNHMDFGVYAVVRKPGVIDEGARVELAP